ncbi:FIST C-terminal domain-containing protein [bacterium]|nr:FIST C-terminal domain-containing protein [bacterium]
MSIIISSSVRPTAASAVEEIAAQIRPSGLKYLLFFTSTQYKPDELIAELSLKYPQTLITGCTSAGEITPQGFQHNGITCAGFYADSIEIAAAVITNLCNFQSTSVKEAVDKCLERLELNPLQLDSRKHFGVTLIDGLSYREESVISALSLAAPSINIIGGSAGDDYKLDKTYVFLNDKCYNDSALFILFKCDVPFEIINQHHFLPTDIEFIVTKANMAKRTIYEINSKSALSEYAGMLNLKPEEITIQITNQNPIGFEVDGKYYIRSVIEIIKKRLRMACSINEGTVFTLMKSGDMIESTRNLFSNTTEKLKSEIGLMILFNCLGRYTEAEFKGITDDIFQAMNVGQLIGMNTYGEQCNSLHLNHSITGVAIGKTR